MSFVVKKLPPAEQDALEAAIWYEDRHSGLGDEFLTEVDRAVRALGKKALSTAFALRTCGGHRCIGSSSTASITSCMNKRSGYWRFFMAVVIHGGWKSGVARSHKVRDREAAIANTPAACAPEKELRLTQMPGQARRRYNKKWCSKRIDEFYRIVGVWIK